MPQLATSDPDYREDIYFEFWVATDNGTKYRSHYAAYIIDVEDGGRVANCENGRYIVQHLPALNQAKEKILEKYNALESDERVPPVDDKMF